MQDQAGFWLSPQQSHVWIAHQQSGTFNAVALVLLEGQLDHDSINRAVSTVIARHEILRTVFRRAPGMKVPFQVVLPAGEADRQPITLAGLDETLQNRQLEDLFERERSRVFDLERGPVAHASSIFLGDCRHALLLTVPSLLSDSHSLQILVEEIGAILAGENDRIPDIAVRYVQFAQWQRDILGSEESDAQQGRSYWNSSNKTGVPAVLPHERQTSRGVFCPESLVRKVPDLRKLQEAADRCGASLEAFVLAAWQSLIWRLSGVADVVTRVFCSGREYEELRHAPGLIGKSLPFLTHFDEVSRFRDVVAQLQDSFSHGSERQEYYAPDDACATEPSISFDYLELFRNEVRGKLRLEILKCEARCERFKLKLSARRFGRELALEFHFDPALMAGELVDRWSGFFLRLLETAVEGPDTLVNRIPLMGDEERRQLLVESNQTATKYPEERCIHELFEAQAEVTPDRTAVRFEGHTLTYRELNDRANQLAHALRKAGVVQDAPVGLCVERGVGVIVAALGILKAGGAYVPLSADNPKTRLTQQLKSAVALVTEQKFLNQIPDWGGQTVYLDRSREWMDQPRTNPEMQSTPENLVYIIYTSGSTGTPKGVAVRHRNLVNYASFIRHLLDLNNYPEGLHFATVSSLSADLGNTCIYASLISGGCLHIISQEMSTDSERLRDYTRTYPIDVLKIVPSHLAALLDSDAAKEVLPRRYLITGGEQLTRQLVEKIAAVGAACEVINHYGPTETTVGSLTLRLKEYETRDSGDAIPIGRPIANTRVYILDSQREPVPTGVAGELYIAGEGVAAGYFGEPARTAERFLPESFSNHPNGIMYRTGDLARYHSDGNIEFLGRADDQVKIRGFRVELGEIEAALAEHSSVKRAVVTARADQGGEKILVAYVVVQPDQSIGADDLHRHLKTHLPDYMVPASFVLLSKLPLTANGKIDRQALPSAEQLALREKEYIAPCTSQEEIVSAIWTEVLRRDRISVTDDFFEIGGQSLSATRIASRLRERFHVPVPVRLIFEHPTVRELAVALADMQVDEGDDMENEIIPIARSSGEQYVSAKAGHVA